MPADSAQSRPPHQSGTSSESEFGGNQATQPKVTPAVEVRDLAVSFGESRILEEVQLSVAPGEIVAILGPSGCGKSTLLRVIAGLQEPTAGEIAIAGTRVSKAGEVLVPPESRKVGYVFQDYALFPALTVLDNVAFGLPRRERHKAGEWLTRIGLGATLERKPDSLSGGEQQRVALARALAPQPAVVLLDEPLANIDAYRRGELGRELVTGIRAAGASAILVTHDRHEALTLADRVAVLLPVTEDSGARVLQVDTPATIYRRPRSLGIARLLGPANTILVRGQGGFAESPLGRLEFLHAAIGTVNVLLRPELMRFTPRDGGASEVVEVRFCGPTTVLECNTPAGRLPVAWPSPDAPPAVGLKGEVTVEYPVWPLPPGEDRCEVLGRHLSGRFAR